MAGRFGRNDAAIAAALEAVAQAVGNQPVGVDAASRSLATFQRENPPVFKGGYDPDGAWSWIKEIERIFSSYGLYSCAAGEVWDSHAG